MRKPRKKKQTPCKLKKGLDGFFRLDKVSEYMTSDAEFVTIMSLSKEAAVLSPIMDEVTKKMQELEEKLQLNKKSTMKDKTLDAGSIL